MARTRKTSGTPSPEAAETQDNNAPEDAVVLGETGPGHADDAPSDDATPAAEETAPELSPETSGAGDTIEPSSAEAGPEPVAEAEPVRADEAPATVAAPPPERSGGSIVLPLVFGGLIAALAGVGAARFVFPDGWPGQSDAAAALSELRESAESQTARIAELEAALVSLQESVSAGPDTDEAIQSLRDDLGARIGDAAGAASQATERLGTLADQLTALNSRVEELAARPAPAGLDGESLDAELARFRSELSAAVDEARANIVAAQDEAAAIAERAAEEAAAQEAAAAAAAEETRAAAEAAATAAAREAALARLRAALDSGEPFAEDLAALDADGVPPTLSDVAADGVPTLAELADAYPEAARAALDASIRAGVGDGALDRFAAFLRVQTGARSLEPRAGDDPDAILSRAEAALRAGELEAALGELGALPEAGQAAMAGWIQSARTRVDALEAAQGLTQD